MVLPWGCGRCRSRCLHEQSPFHPHQKGLLLSPNLRYYTETMSYPRQSRAANSPFSARTTSYLISVWIALNVLDVIITHIGLQRGLVEGNWFPGLIVGNLGEVQAYAFKMAIVIGAIPATALIARRLPWAWICLVGASIAMGIAIMWNLSLIL